jgi:nucleotide-binding universal stress UspA family protein
VAQQAPPTTIVVGVDGSEAGERAARLAASLAQQDGGRLVVACVVPVVAVAVQTAEENEARHVAKQREVQEAQEGVVDPRPGRAGRRRRAGRGGGPARPPGGGALRHRDASAAPAHLVVGRRGQSKVRSLLFGSTPGNLIQIADVPVTVVP